MKKRNLPKWITCSSIKKATIYANLLIKLANILGIVSNENVHYRATFIIDTDNVIQHVSVNALHTGRSHEELYRTVEAPKADGLTGCDWQAGDDYVA